MTLNHHALLIYDGDCGFCQKSARLARAWSNGRITITAWQDIPQQMQTLGLLEDKVYRWVADNRTRLPGGTPQCSSQPR